MILAAGGAPRAQAQGPEDSPSLSLSWDPVEGASRYELRLIHRESGEPQIYQVEDTDFKTSMLPGLYDFQIRSFDGQGVAGTWSEPFEIEVKHLSDLKKSPAPRALLELNPLPGRPGEALRARVDFEWIEMPGARLYQFQVRGTGGYRHQQRTTKGELSLALPLGQVYEWDVRVVTGAGVLYESRAPAWRFALQGAPVDSPSGIEVEWEPRLSLSWAAVPKASHYEVELQRRDLLGEEWVTVVQEGRWAEAQWQPEGDFRPGHYRLRLRAFSPGHQPSAVQEKSFDLKPSSSSLSSFR